MRAHDSKVPDKQMRHYAAWFMALLLAVIVVPVHNTDAQIIYGQNATIRQGLIYQSWTLDQAEGDKTDLSQVLVPLSAVVPLRDNLELSVSTAIQRSAGNNEALDVDISGLADSRVQLSHSFANDRFLVAAAARIPTGQSSFEDDELTLASFIAEDYLYIPLKNLGEGFGMSAMAGTAIPAGDWVLGAAMGYEAFGSYEPTSESISYTPGARATITIGADRPFSNGKIRADLIYVRSGEDESEGSPVFQDGGQTSVRVIGIREFSKSRVEGSARLIMRGKDKRRQDANQIETDPEKFNGNEFRIGGRGTFMVGPKLNAYGGMTGKFVAANDFETSDPLYDPGSRVFGFEAGAEINVSPMAKLGFGARFYTGSIKEIPESGFGATDISGFEISQVLIYSL